MNKFNWKSLLPHIGAVVIFLIIALVYCKPALEGKVLQQSDIVHWKGMAQNAIEYKAKHGSFPLWNTNLFSGMPNYQVAMEGKSILPDFNGILTLWLPKPVNFFFLACICFYILCMAYGADFLVSVLGSLAFAYCSYDPIIISVGHETKMMAIAYMPALLAGLVLLYEKKYITGFFVTALFATMEISSNHPQINFYFAVVAVFVTVSYAVRWIMAGEWKHLLIAGGLAILGTAIGLGSSAISLLTTSEYSKYTIRGGKTIDNSGGELKQVKTTGLDEDYAFSYSAGRSEFLTFLMPNALGGSSNDRYDEDSKIVTALTDKGVREDYARDAASQIPKYWGGILPSTSGPVYLGAVICILFLIGLVVLDNKYRWWILAAVVFGVVISWGKYFEAFNKLLFLHLPLYDKFRAPSMAMVIPQLLFPLMAVLALQKLFYAKNNREELKKHFKAILIVVGGAFAVLFLVYLLGDFSSDLDKQIREFGDARLGGNGHTLINAVLDERKALFEEGLLQALLFACITVGAIFLYLKTSIKPVVFVVILLVINTGNLLYIGAKYLNDDNYVDADPSTPDSFTPNAADIDIMKDKSPHYRVLNLAQDWTQESITAYYHRCIGGYHPAKLRIYQDLIENQDIRNNKAILNMLDTKYLIAPPQQQGQQYGVIPNDSALGACWFVKEVKYVNGPVEEMKALSHFDPAQTAFVDSSFRSLIPGQPGADTAAKIKLDAYDNDDVKYSTSSTANQFAVLSEVYYPAGWKAFIDGKKVDYAKVNYVLRGLYVPAGNHSIEFKFEPESFAKGQRYSFMAGILLWLALLAFAWDILKNLRNAKPEGQPKAKA